MEEVWLQMSEKAIIHLYWDKTARFVTSEDGPAQQGAWFLIWHEMGLDGKETYGGASSGGHRTLKEMMKWFLEHEVLFIEKFKDKMGSDWEIKEEHPNNTFVKGLSEDTLGHKWVFLATDKWDFNVWTCTNCGSCVRRGDTYSECPGVWD